MPSSLLRDTGWVSSDSPSFPLPLKCAAVENDEPCTVVSSWRRHSPREPHRRLGCKMGGTTLFFTSSCQDVKLEMYSHPSSYPMRTVTSENPLRMSVCSSECLELLWGSWTPVTAAVTRDVQARGCSRTYRDDVSCSSRTRGEHLCLGTRAPLATTLAQLRSTLKFNQRSLLSFSKRYWEHRLI